MCLPTNFKGYLKSTKLKSTDILCTEMNLHVVRLSHDRQSKKENPKRICVFQYRSGKLGMANKTLEIFHLFESQSKATSFSNIKPASFHPLSSTHMTACISLSYYKRIRLYIRSRHMHWLPGIRKIVERH